MKRYRTKAATVGLLMAVTLAATPARAGQPGFLDPVMVLALPIVLVAVAVAGVKRLADEAGNGTTTGADEARQADAAPQTTGDALPASAPEAGTGWPESVWGPGTPD